MCCHAARRPLYAEGLAHASFREGYAAGIEERISARRAAREAAWTEGLAVGSRLFVERVAREVGRTETICTELPAAGTDAWCVRETPESGYATEIAPKTGG